MGICMAAASKKSQKSGLTKDRRSSRSAREISSVHSFVNDDRRESPFISR